MATNYLFPCSYSTENEGYLDISGLSFAFWMLIECRKKRHDGFVNIQCQLQTIKVTYIYNSAFLVLQYMGSEGGCGSWPLAVTHMISARKQIIYGLCGSNDGFAPIPLKTREHQLTNWSSWACLCFAQWWCRDCPFDVNRQFWLMNFNQTKHIVFQQTTPNNYNLMKVWDATCQFIIIFNQYESLKNTTCRK